MILRLTLISGEVEDFSQEYKIDADSSFGDLHRLILKSCGYKEIPGQRFFICDENWKPENRILLEDDGSTSIDSDIYLMDDTDLGEFIEDEGQRIAYRFDPENRRMFLIEVAETIFGESVPEEGEMVHHQGKAPIQIHLDDTPIVNNQASIVSEELGEEFYGEEGFDEEDIDAEGFDFME